MPKQRATPTFTVITVVYQGEATLEETILSVIAQTWHRVEYIVVDGASTDGTLSILEKYRPHITHLVSEPDNGLYDAMNKAMTLATGDYLCFLNAGDSFHEDDTLQQMVHRLPRTDELPDILYGETAIVDARRHFLRMRRLSAPDVLTWKSFRHGMMVCHQAFFVKRTLAAPYDLRYRFSSDFDWCIRMMKKAHTICNTHLTLIDYLEEGMTTANHKASLRERFRIMVRHYGWLSTLWHHAWFVVRLGIRR
ncbi:MAG: glycosyltransferase [Prevotellaceae bacterium]|jgi:glycosyltransferase involved in cell wall biosynthesis|nr:glycosyltransferase [Prevotellaceae bacterium]